MWRRWTPRRRGSGCTSTWSRSTAWRCAWCPLNLLQVELLRRKRQAPGEEQAPLQQALALSINGIVAGMRNTG